MRETPRFSALSVGRGGIVYGLDGSRLFVIAAAVARAIGIDSTAQNFRSSIKTAASISDNPDAAYKSSFRRRCGRLHVQGNFLQSVAAGFELIAVVAFQNSVGLSL